MSAHTPGPWQVKSEHEPDYIVGDIDGPLEDNVMHYSPVCMVSETAQFEANARLIAAAPELLAALKFLALRAGKVPESAFPSRIEYECMCEAHEEAMAAIAKATEAA